MSMKKSSVILCSARSHVKPSLRPKPFTKRELLLALPRKSFFSCHEKALKESKFPNKQQSESRRDGTTLAVLSSVRPKTSNDSGKFIPTTTKSEIPRSERHKSQCDVTDPNIPSEKSENCPKTTAKNEPMLNAKKDDIMNEPLFQYLKFVKENKADFLLSLQAARTLPEVRHDSMIKIGQVFESRHYGGLMRTKNKDIVLVAVNSLCPRSRKSVRKRTCFSDINSMKQPDNVALKAGENDKTVELEKLKQKAEDWMETASTYRLREIKQKVLQELGYDDKETVAWWQNAHQCQYLRL